MVSGGATHVFPPSVVMSTPPSFEQIIRSGFFGSIHRSCVSPWCSPRRLLNVRPPSRETYRSLPGPPLVISHGRRRVCQKPAKTTRGLFGSIATSEHPVSSFLNNTFCHVLPPSVVR